MQNEIAKGNQINLLHTGSPKIISNNTAFLMTSG
jgi:hypothetical protein